MRTTDETYKVTYETAQPSFKPRVIMKGKSVEEILATMIGISYIQVMDLYHINALRSKKIHCICDTDQKLVG